jgi:MFS family permease
VSRKAGFWLVAYLFAVTMLGNTLPTPLYVLYQAKWHFSSGMVTLIFATYAAGVLAALLLAGRSSDQVGRRPVLAAALGLSVVSAVVFILASGVAWLFAGRLLSGMSAGLVTGTGTATLTEMAGEASVGRASIMATAAATGGLGLGPLMAGFFAEYAPNPTVLVFEVYLVLLAIAAVGLAMIPETVRTRNRLDLGFVGFRIPESAKRQFFAAAAAGFAALALLGLFTALAPSFLGSVLKVRNLAVGGALVFMLFAASTVTQIALGRRPALWNTRLGLFLYIAALALIVGALEQSSMAIFVVGTIVAGVAVGATFIGSLSRANRLAPPETRGQVVSTYFTFAYVGLTIPVITVGFAAEQIDYLGAVSACAAGLAVLCVLTLVLGGRAGAASSPA